MSRGSIRDTTGAAVLRRRSSHSDFFRVSGERVDMENLTEAKRMYQKYPGLAAEHRRVSLL